MIRLEDGRPIRFGADGGKGVVRNHATGDLEVVDVTPANESQVLVHDAGNASPTTRSPCPDSPTRTPCTAPRSESSAASSGRSTTP